MHSRHAHLLCTGKEPGLLLTRCAVLNRSGHDAQPANLSEAEVLVRTQKFDLVIVSAWLNECDKKPLLAAAGKTPILELTGLTPADDLLTKVEQMLAASFGNEKTLRCEDETVG